MIKRATADNSQSEKEGSTQRRKRGRRKESEQRGKRKESEQRKLIAKERWPKALVGKRKGKHLQRERERAEETRDEKASKKGTKRGKWGRMAVGKNKENESASQANCMNERARAQ